MVTPLSSPVMIELNNVSKAFDGHDKPVLNDIGLHIQQGEFVALMGPSGSGKSTLLNLIGAIDRPSKGSVSIAGVRIDSMSDSQLAAFRRDTLGFVFQLFNLLPTLTVTENVMLPLQLQGHLSHTEMADRVALYLQKVGMSHRASAFPSVLSGGEMQRVAIARALISQPKLILADEPTGNLDSENGAQVMQLLTELVNEENVTLLLATHSDEVARQAHRQLHIRDGLLHEVRNPMPQSPKQPQERV